MEHDNSFVSRDRSSFAVWAIALAVALVHVFTNNRYGLHRDELQVLSDALHMDWGFVAYPPFTPFVERVSMTVFGHWLIGLRLASVVAQLFAVVVTGSMARELGGGRLAQALAALSVALAPLALFEGTEFQYTTFDYLWWVLIAYFVIKLLKTENPRWCLAIGAVVGLGMMTKYTMVFYAGSVVAALALTRGRKFLASGWFWAGIALAFVICLPNVIWQLRHDLISYHFLQHIHVRDVGEGRGEGFFKDQLWIDANAASLPLWVAGLILFFRDARYRALAWMFVIPEAFFALTKARFYYVGAAYPMLLAMGAVGCERWLETVSRGLRRTVAVALFAAIALTGAVISMVQIPWTSAGPVKEFALKNNGDLREEIGWDELVRAVAGVRDSLPPEQRANYGVLVGNYGEMGAIEIMGPEYQLPPPISLTNSGYLRSFPQTPPAVLIVVGWSQRQVDEAFTSCRLAGHNGNSQGVENEESKYHEDIFVCTTPKRGWEEFWKTNQRFG